MVKDSGQAAQIDTVQGAGEDSKGDVQSSTSTANRSQQRSNASVSAGSMSSSAGQQDSAVRGLMNLYEIAVLYDPGLEIDMEKASGKIEKIITDAGGKITDSDNWGKRKLAYPISKNDFAVYVFYSVQMPPEAAHQIEQALNIADEVIRFMITKPDLKAKAKAEALAKEKAAKAAERGERDDNEENDEERE